MTRRYRFVLLAVAACATAPSPQAKKEPEVAGKSIESTDLDVAAMEHGYARPPLREFTINRGAR